MYKKLLTKNFFKDNPYAEHSVQRFVYSVLLYKGIEDVVSEIIKEHGLLSGERLKQSNASRELIQSAYDLDIIFQLLRKKTDINNQGFLIKKALEHEETIIPMVLEKLIRSYHDIFIENSIRLLAKTHNDYTILLKEKYIEIRNPYVQSLVCLVIGFRGEEDTIPWMLDKFFELKKLYPAEIYDQGPLLALHELNSRFYQNKE